MSANSYRQPARSRGNIVISHESSVLADLSSVTVMVISEACVCQGHLYFLTINCPLEHFGHTAFECWDLPHNCLVFAAKATSFYEKEGVLIYYLLFSPLGAPFFSWTGEASERKEASK